MFWGVFWCILEGPEALHKVAISNKIDLKILLPVPLVALGFDQVQQQYLLEYHQQRQNVREGVAYEQPKMANSGMCSGSRTGIPTRFNSLGQQVLL